MSHDIRSNTPHTNIAPPQSKKPATKGSGKEDHPQPTLPQQAKAPDHSQKEAVHKILSSNDIPGHVLAASKGVLIKKADGKAAQSKGADHKATDHKTNGPKPAKQEHPLPQTPAASHKEAHGKNGGLEKKDKGTSTSGPANPALPIKDPLPPVIDSAPPAEVPPPQVVDIAPPVEDPPPPPVVDTAPPVEDPPPPPVVDTAPPVIVEVPPISDPILPA